MNTKTTPRLHIRWMIRRDLAQVVGIEAQSRLTWGTPEYIDFLRKRNSIGFVAEMPDESIGGAYIYELEKRRLIITRFIVDPDRRRAGIGTAMMNKLKSKLSSDRRCQIVFDVPDDALDLQLFLKAQGFEAVEILREWEEYRFRYAIEESALHAAYDY